jgi:hypothetical protein
MRDLKTGEVRPKKRPGFTGRRGLRVEPDPETSEAATAIAPDVFGEGEDFELAKDPEPKRGSGPIRDAANKKSPVKVTPAVRKDIRAKLALLLGLPASIVKRRDPVCGTVMLQQVPDVSDALADIMCDSPDLVAFFTSSGSGYMKWLTLATALQPVLETGFKHHVSHSIGNQENEGSGPPVHQDWSRYAAPAI